MPGRTLFTLFLLSAKGVRNLSRTLGNGLVHVRHRLKADSQNSGSEFAFEPLQDERHIDPVSDYMWVESECTRQLSIIFLEERHFYLSPFAVTKTN
jgi:hypothetical protein